MGEQFEWECLDKNCEFRSDSEVEADAHSSETDHFVFHNWSRDHAADPSGWWFVPEGAQ